MYFRKFTILILIAFLLVSVVPLTAQDTIECEEGFRLIENDFIVESVCVPDAPERIVALGFDTTALLFLLDIAPVAYDSWWVDLVLSSNPELESTIDQLLMDAVLVGERGGGGQSLELLLESQPDLILLPNYEPETYDELSAIAPTIMYELGSTNDWRNVMTLTGEAIGRPEAVEMLIAQVDERIAVLQEMLSEQDNPTTMSLMGFYGRPTPFLLLGALHVHELIREVNAPLEPVVGLTTEEIMQEYETTIVELSTERLDLLESDRLIVVFNNPSAIEQFDDFTSSPLWSALSVVESEQVYTVGAYWYSGNPYDIHKIIDDMFQILLNVDPAEVSPNPFLAEMVDMDMEEETEETSD